MPLDLKVIHIKEFLRMNPAGEFDLARSKEALAGIAKAASEAGEVDVLLDIRGFESHMSTVDIYELAGELGNYREAFKNKVALLDIRDERFEQAEFFETCARNWGFQVRVFTEFESAIEWLRPAAE